MFAVPEDRHLLADCEQALELLGAAGVPSVGVPSWVARPVLEAEAAQYRSEVRTDVPDFGVVLGGPLAA